MRKLRSAAVILLPLFVAAGATAASFIVPTDRELVRAAKAIVIATTQSSYMRAGDHGMIYTVYVMRVDDVIKGAIASDAPLEVVEPGGALDGRYVVVPEAASYRAGERALIFLDTNDRDEWRTWSMVLGKFSFVHDLHGTRLLTRGADEGAIFGWDATGNRYREVVRSEEKFLQFVRAEAGGASGDASYVIDESKLAWPKKVKTAVNGAGFHACDYTLPLTIGPDTFCGVRWHCIPSTDGSCAQGIFDQPGGSGSVGFTRVGTQSGGVNGVTGVDAGMAAWNGDTLSNVTLVDNGAGAAAWDQTDTISSIHFDDNTDTALCGVAAVGCTRYGGAGDPYTFDGGSFVPTSNADVAFKAGFTGNQSLFDQIATHELGHTLGFRHSDVATPSTSTAVMVSVATTVFGAVLQTWDHDAVSTVYNPNPGAALPAAPTGVLATGTSNTVVHVTWNAVTGATQYKVYRSTDGTNYTLAGTVVAPTTFLDDGGRTADKAYLYKVHTINGGESLDSNRDLATTVMFTDDPLVMNSTLVRVAHITQLRTAVDAVRAMTVTGGGSYTDSTLTVGTKIKAAHINDLRAALDLGRSNLSLTALNYAETVTMNSTKIKASHINELRNGVK